MSTIGSVSEWIEQVGEGSEEAARSLFNRFSASLLAKAGGMASSSDPITDEDDVVQEAFASCLQAIQAGAYPDVKHRGEFWFLLVRIAERQAIDFRRRGKAEKRGREGMVHGSALGREVDSPGSSGIDGLASDEISPELALTFAEETRRLMEMLAPDLQQVVQHRMAGHTNAEIAKLTGKSRATIERRARLIRDIWRQELENDD